MGILQEMIHELLKGLMTIWLIALLISAIAIPIILVWILIKIAFLGGF